MYVSEGHRAWSWSRSLHGVRTTCVSEKCALWMGRERVALDTRVVFRLGRNERGRPEPARRGRTRPPSPEHRLADSPRT